MSDVTIDLETLATSHNSVVLTLGAVKFNPFTLQEPYERLYIRLDADDQIAKGRDVSESTMEWWMKQSPEIQEEALGAHDRTSIESTLAQLNKFLVGADKIWVQGPHFDITILESLYKQYGVPTNWQYWQIMDSRTLFGVHGDPRDKASKTAHNAVEDCISQSKGVQKTFKALGLTKYANRF